MVDIRVIDAHVRKLRVKINQLLNERTVRPCFPESPAIITSGIFNRVCKQEIAIRQNGKIRDKIINKDTPLETAIKSIDKYPIAVTIHYEQLITGRKDIKTFYCTVIAGTLALAVKTFQKLSFIIEEIKGV